MSYLTNEDAVARYLVDVTNGGLYLTGPGRRTYIGGTIRVANDELDTLIYHRVEKSDRRGWGPVILSRYARGSRTLVLNGDGFTDNTATRWQTHVRGVVQRSSNEENRGGWRTVNLGMGTRYIIIPYVAMDAAGIVLPTIRPIEVTEDRNEEVVHRVPAPPARSAFRITGTERGGQRRTLEATKRGLRYRTHEIRRMRYRHRQTRELLTGNYYRAPDGYDPVPAWEPTATYQVWQAGRRVPAGWQAIAPVRLDSKTYRWVENIHHLGASVFYAKDESGSTRRFVSGFDSNEPRPLYYLAQLPNKGRITTYEEALDALMPPLVKQARDNGVPVLRQGDVFAIETDRTDEWVYSNARTRVRREIALHNGERQNLTPPELDERDHRERAPCPCCGHSSHIGWGPRSRRALMIYGTSHTATEVVVVSGGAVYIRGTMHHDPYLEEPGRRPEHVTVNLGDENRWYLAVRNTVPRRRQTNGAQREEETA
jgi:hypothetical protein